MPWGLEFNFASCEVGGRVRVDVFRMVSSFLLCYILLLAAFLAVDLRLKTFQRQLEAVQECIKRAACCEPSPSTETPSLTATTVP